MRNETLQRLIELSDLLKMDSIGALGALGRKEYENLRIILERHRRTVDSLASFLERLSDSPDDRTDEVSGS